MDLGDIFSIAGECEGLSRVDVAEVWGCVEDIERWRVVKELLDFEEGLELVVLYLSRGVKR